MMQEGEKKTHWMKQRKNNEILFSNERREVEEERAEEAKDGKSEGDSKKLRCWGK
jgi:hypothetical protein